MSRIILIIIGIFITGCGRGNSKNGTSEIGITDEKLLSCFDEATNFSYMTDEEFVCFDTDLSEADISQLGRLPKLKKVILKNTNLSSIVGLKSINNINYLSIEDNYTYHNYTYHDKYNISVYEFPPLDLQGISQLTNLKTLNLSNNYITDLSPISSLVNIETLLLNEIYGQKAGKYDYHFSVDLSPLINLKKLNKLELSGNYTSSDYCCYPYGDNRYHYYATDPFTGFFNLARLANLENLQKLNISHSYVDTREEYYTNYIGLFTNLTNLDISDNIVDNLGSKYSTLVDLDFVTRLVNLKDLNLYRNQVSNINALFNLKLLENLDLSNNKIYNDPFDGLSTWYMLGSLDSISALTKLKTLNLNDTYLFNSDFNNIQFSNLINLDTLSIANNYIEDITPIIDLNIENIDLKQNCITNFLNLDLTLDIGQNNQRDQRDCN